MLSPLMNNPTALPEGSLPEAAETTSAPREPGVFARILTSCLKNPGVSGKVLSPLPELLKNPSDSFSSFALVSLLQGKAKAFPGERGKDAALVLLPEGQVALPDEVLRSPFLSVPEAPEGIHLPVAEADVLLRAQGNVTIATGLPGPEEKSAEAEGIREADTLLPACSSPPPEDGAEAEVRLSPQPAEIVAAAASSLPAPVVLPAEEKSPRATEPPPESKEVSSGKKLQADPALLSSLRKDGSTLLASEDLAEETGERTVPLPGARERTGSEGQNGRNGDGSFSSQGGEGEKPSLSEKAPPAARIQGQDNNRKTHEELSADRNGQKEPQPLRSRDGDSSFSSLLRAAGPAEAKGQPGVARGAEVPLSGRNGEALGEGMTNVVRFLRRDGLHRASIVVEPPALGRVEIELSSTAGGVEASIRVGSEQLRQLVQDQLAVLRSSLSQQGVQMTSCTVDIGDGGMGSRGDKNPGETQKVHAAQSDSDRGEETLSFRVDLEQGLLCWMA